MLFLYLGIGSLLLLFVSYQFAWWRSTISYEHPRILMYHMISHHRPKARFNKLRVDPVEFEKQICWLKDNGWNFVFVSELTQETTSKRVAITFDDGYRDNLLAADPILKRHGAKATLYLVTDRHDRDWSTSKKEHHSDGELRREPKLLDEDVRYMLESNRWEIGGHSLTHANLLSISKEQCEMEIGLCKVDLENQFNCKVDSFAYPFGFYGNQQVDLVRQSGYAFAVTTEQGISQNLREDQWRLKRVKVSGRDGLTNFRLRMRTGKCRMRD